METKIVYFGRIKTIQIQCPKCKEWQFKSEKCSDCGLVFIKNKNKDKEKKTEYRSEVPGVCWQDKIKPSIRKIIYERDEFVCQYCGNWLYENYKYNNRALTIDHLIPRSGGGTNEIENLVTCCFECNVIKNNKRFSTFEEAREYILKRKNNYEIL